jgi:hypothetical protein
MSKLLGGSALLLLSLFMLLGFLNSSRPLSLPVAVFTLLVAVGIPAGTGGALLWSYFRGRLGFRRSRDELREQTYQSEILRLAERKGGKLTVVEVVSEAALDTGTAERLLQGFVVQGTADIEITDSGVLVYAFHDIQKLGEKSSSRDVLDD